MSSFAIGSAVPDDITEPAQIYGSTQVELAWTVIPVLIVVVLFLTTARMIFAIQDAPPPKTALDVTVVGHQFWWEFNYPKLGIHAVNELHVPLSDPPLSTPTYLKLLVRGCDSQLLGTAVVGQDRSGSKQREWDVD